jgi:hypothetical protein
LTERASLEAERCSSAFLLLRLGANLFSISSEILRGRLALRPFHRLGRSWLWFSRSHDGRRGLSYRGRDGVRRFRLRQRVRHKGEQGKAGEEGHRESGDQTTTLRDCREGRRRDGARRELRCGLWDRGWRVLDPFKESDEAVASPVHGLDDRGSASVVAQRLADRADRLFDRAGGEVLDSPHPVQQLLLREDLRRLLRQHLQHAEGVGTEAHLPCRP